MKKSISLVMVIVISIFLVASVSFAEDLLAPKDSVLPIFCSEGNLNPTDFVAQNDLLAQNTCPAGWLNCYVSCGSTTNACCPREYPYLNYCDCQCYNASPDCSRGYANCR